MNVLKNIQKVYESATPAELRAGLNWYNSARKFCHELADAHNLTIETVAGVVAALSPMCEWEKNKRDAVSLIKTGYAPVLNRKMAEKAKRILSGAEPLDELKAPKTRRFYMNIVNPNSEVVTVDRHALGCAFMSRRVKVPTPKQYREIEKAYQTVASEVGLRPHRLQAVCWIVWKRRDINQLQLLED